ncbi:beta-ribofuranosylaminobenzene 5'-phosphate synthase family protein [Rhodopirellula maiorica SM1]|uniref:Beta-ribofuranosylaminobenzene 5'-phosphate synthase family protein n=2 Tax=Novipirellula TaxID=2795426 RepID=M5S3U8_9BACT|nr:beta-ribofuranosylaminobenzene 5'-phosphate synthase family protein [Rhodopirellula maiorica SM1]
MVDDPITEVVARRADAFQGPAIAANRVLGVAERYRRQFQLDALPACKIEIVRRPPAHTGLGTGTQLAMAVAEAISQLLHPENADQRTASRIADRGRRSAVGIHGYRHGGLIYEDADQAAELNPIRQRLDVPKQWCVAILRPIQETMTISGEVELDQFAKLPATTSEQRDHFRTQITTQLLPAIENSDFDAFSEAVHQYNRDSGLLFESVQNGPYNGVAVSLLVDFLRSNGIKGVGQSSWGPSVFAWFATRDQAQQFVSDQIDQAKVHVLLTHAKNDPRQIESQS